MVDLTNGKSVLVAYATNAGSTLDVARMVGEELSGGGFAVEVKLVDEVDSLENYDAVIVGAPMILKWHQDALNFVKKNQNILCNIPVAYFFTAMNLTKTGAGGLDGIPFSIDPKTAQPPQRSGRLSFKERYALPVNYLKPVLKAAKNVKPLNVGFFGGKLAMYNLKWWQAIFVMLVIQAKPGGTHNESFIREWAREIGSQLPV